MLYISWICVQEVLSRKRVESELLRFLWKANQCISQALLTFQFIALQIKRVLKVRICLPRRSKALMNLFFSMLLSSTVSYPSLFFYSFSEQRMETPGEMRRTMSVLLKPQTFKFCQTDNESAFKIVMASFSCVIWLLIKDFSVHWDKGTKSLLFEILWELKIPTSHQNNCLEETSMKI